MITPPPWSVAHRPQSSVRVTHKSENDFDPQVSYSKKAAAKTEKRIIYKPKPGAKPKP